MIKKFKMVDINDNLVGIISVISSFLRVNLSMVSIQVLISWHHLAVYSPCRLQS
jgi:hypothetical protein